MDQGDLPVVRDLLKQLGYPQDLAEVTEKFHQIQTQADHALFVAEDRGEIIGMMHLYLRYALEVSPAVMIQSLVVDEQQRGKGYGTKFMDYAENWARERNIPRIRLSSAHRRTETHEFYKSLGFENPGLTFKKDLIE